jgi:hypothetical protein
MAAAAQPLPGVRRWIDGTALVSSGVRALDGVLGGGCALGSLVLLEADWGAAPYAHAVASLWAAQALAARQRLAVLAPAPARAAAFLRALPARARGTAAAAAGDAGGAAPTPFCDVFDLNGRLPAAAAAAAGARALHHCRGCSPPAWRAADFACNDEPPPCCAGAGAGRRFAQGGDGADGARACGDLVRCVGEELGDGGGGGGGGGGGVQRLLVLGLCEPAWPAFVSGGDAGAAARAAAPLLRALLALRALVQARTPAPPGGGGAVLLVTAALHHLPPAVAARVRAAFDAALKVHAFADPPWALAAAAAPATAGTAPEFADFHGLLLVRKVVRPAAVCGVPADSDVYCLKRDRRKLVLELPHLPPEDADGAPAQQAPARAPAPRAGAGRAVGVGAESEDAVAAESDEVDALEPSADDVAATTGQPRRRGGGLACASTLLDF